MTKVEEERGDSPGDVSPATCIYSWSLEAAGGWSESETLSEVL